MFSFTTQDGRNKKTYQGITRLRQPQQMHDEDDNILLAVVWYEGEPEMWLVYHNYEGNLYKFYQEFYGIDSKQWLLMPVFYYAKFKG